ncbi:Neuroligin-1 [Lucilia cuprina]|nr:Neuroligin-1 [Lucilia cuprina]
MCSCSAAQRKKVKKDTTNSLPTTNPQTVFQLNSFKNGDLLKTTKHKGFKQKLADNTNFAKQILSNNNNFHKNSRHKESKQQKFLQKCQHFLSTILLYYCCSCYCIWHIYGFPLVLVKIFKYLKDSTVHALTRRRLKIATTLASSITTAAAAATATTTSIVYNDSNFIAACVGKLKKPTKMADYKSNNQQNVLKRQTTHKTTVARTITTTALRKAKTFVGTCAYSSSSCSTTSLTGSSAYSSSPENLILQQEQQQSQQTWTPYCYYQQQPHLHQRHHHHQQELLPKQQQQQQQLLRCYQPTLPHSQPHYSTSTNSFLHLPQPSLLAFSRTLIILILLSSLWHTSEGFHGSGVKLSTNTVKTKYGLVRGIVVRSSPSLVEAYLGIPYASPPVGSLRFMPPITPSTWKNVRNADRFSPVCPQNVPIPPNGPEALLEVPRARLAQLRRLLPLLSNQSEDCLYLNIYVPYEHRRHRRFTTNSGELNDTPKLPIILFIHGESYEWNSGNPYDGSELAAHGNVIVVTINFRLGIFGFLKTGGKESAQDLIQHTVLVSGSALSPWAIQKNPLFVKRRVAEQTGCHGDMLYYDLAPCLRTKTVAELLAVKIDHPRFLVGFAPFIDGTVISPNTDSIGIEYANFPKRNLIFCLTSVESHLDLSAQDLEFGFNETRRDRILRTYNEYTDWDKAIRSPLSSRDATLQFLSDGHTASSLIKLGYMHSLRGGRGYFLHFKHRTVEEEYPQRTGSVRGEDVPFWLGLPISPLFPHNYTTQEKQISRLMLRYLANFAKTGNPNQSSLSTSGQPSSSSLIVDVETAAAREALNLAVLYNQRRTKRTYYKRHSRSNDDHSGSASSEVNYFLSLNNNNNNNKLDGDELPFWDAYDVVNQLYMELGNKAEIQSHYRGHKLSMWLNLIPQLHRHANMNDQSMRHHQFQDDLNNLNLYEGIVRAQIQTKPDDDDETILLPKGRPTPPPVAQETNTTQKPNGGTTECGVDGAMFVAEMTTIPPSDNRSLVLDSREKEMATASTGLIGNLEVLRRLSGKQFQSYTTALVATVAVGCFLLILNILIFAGIYHQREKRARDAKTKEELQDNDTSKNSSMLKLNALGSETGSFNGSGAGVSGKTTVVFGEYSCYDEKSLQTKDEKLMVELPPPQMIDPNWPACSTSTLDLLKTKHHTPLDTTYTLSNVVPINTESQTDHLMAVNAMEMSTYNPLPMTSGLIIDPTLAAATATSSSGLLSKRGSFVGSASQLNQYDFASVQSSDQMSFKDIENAVKASATMDDDITHDDDIPEPPPPPRSFHNMQQQQQQQQQQGVTNVPAAASGSGGGGGILRQAGTTSSTQTGGGKKRVHIQEISV